MKLFLKYLKCKNRLTPRGLKNTNSIKFGINGLNTLPQCVQILFDFINDIFFFPNMIGKVEM
ncbi:hypothetical protein LDENG_00276800 [Lucifuga dentata]|nr:hypothetical protein LDENG_00276800 [Lucifuga dentata]